MRLILIENGAMLSDVVMQRDEFVVGSGEDCRLRLPDSRIGAHQLVFTPEGDTDWMIEQIHAETPVLVNSTRLVTRQLLKTGDEVSVLDFVIRVFPEYLETGGAVAPLPESSAAAVMQMARFAAFRLPPGTVVKKIEEPLALLASQVHRVGRMSLALSQCVAPEQVMNVALDALQQVFTAQRVWMGIRRVNYGSMEYTEGRVADGKAFDLPETGSKLQPRVLDRGQFLLIPRVSPEDSSSVLAAPLTGPEGNILGMLYLESGEGSRRYEVSDLDYLILLANMVAVQLDAVFRQIAKNRQSTIDGEVSVAHEIQARVTPRKLPQWETLQFGAFREPGRQRTGDVYDLVRLQNNMAAFIVANTPAVGPLPSMLMAQVQAAFRSASMHNDAPHVFMRCMNWILYDGQRDHPLDCVMCMADPATGELRYATAGRMGAFIIGRRGEERPLLGPDSPVALGLERHVNYQTQTERLAPSETLVLFTRGVTTAKNRLDDVFGEERFINILCDGFGQLASNMLKEMLMDLRNFTEGGSQPDDVTVLLAHHPQ